MCLRSIIYSRFGSKSIEIVIFVGSLPAPSRIYYSTIYINDDVIPIPFFYSSVRQRRLADSCYQTRPTLMICPARGGANVFFIFDCWKTKRLSCFVMLIPSLQNTHAQIAVVFERTKQSCIDAPYIRERISTTHFSIQNHRNSLKQKESLQMRVPPTMNARRARPVSSAEKECGVQIETALRIRPLSRKERDDMVVLEAHGPELASLSGGNARREYHFNHVLPDSTSQDKIYNTLGLPIVTETMKNSSSSRKPKSHLFISMGVENSGKTYTCFGGATIQKKRAAQDGLVPRLLDTLFAQSSRAGSGSKGFAVQLSMMQVTQAKGGQSSQIHDLLANASTSKNKLFSPPKKKKNLNVRNMAARFERALPSPRKTQKASDGPAVLDVGNLKPVIQSCQNISEAREALQNGLSASTIGTLYITVQPVVDGNKIGDKICILEMAGAGKENEAVIDCLRELQHNSNGKPKKSVSFRNHKVTMMLNPLFLQSSFVNITLLLTAYPGHTDFQEKKMFLNGLETLHSTTQSSTSAHDSMNRHRASEVNDRDSQRESRNDEKSRHAVSSSRRDERQNTYPPQDSRDPRSSVKGPPVVARMAKAKPVHSIRRDYPPTVAVPVSTATTSVAKPNARPSARKQQDISSLMHQKSNERKVEPSAPAFDDVHDSYANTKKQDTSSRVYQKSNQGRVEPSAPAFDEVQESFGNSKKLKERAMDFPGLDMSAPKSDDRIVTAEEERNYSRERRHARALPTTKKEELRSPLGRSSLENCDHTSSNKKGKARGVQQRTVDNKHSSQENSTTAKSFEADFGNFEHPTEGKNDDVIKKLKEQLQKTVQEKNSLEKMCSQLESENAELRKLSRTAGKITSTEREEEEQRRLRREAQNRIKAPVREHLDRVNYIYDIKNQWCMTNKTHFSLRYPERFQRAPVLDIRDRETEHLEDLKNLSRKETLKDNETETEKTGSTNTRRSVTPPRRTSLPKATKSPPPTGLSALRRLVGGN